MYTFSNTGYLSLDDPYVKETKKKEAAPKQFLTSPGKKGFPYQNYQSLYEKEPYYDPSYHQRKAEKEKRSKIPVSFKPSSPPKKSSGSGGYFGTIGGRFEHMQDYEVVKKGDKPKSVSPQLKNILTSSPKKGTYGFSNLGIGKDYGRLPNVTDDYDAIKKMTKKENDDHRAKLKGAFKSGKTYKNDFFDENPFRDAPVPESKSKTAKSETEKKVIVPFKPSSPPKRGGTIGKYPEYISEATLPPKKEKGGKQEEKQMPVWKSVSNAKNGPTRSILFGTM